MQVVLIQHAAAFNRLVLDKRLEDAKAKDKLTATEELADGARLDNLSSDDIMAMAASGGVGLPKVIKIRKDNPDGNPVPPEQGE